MRMAQRLTGSQTQLIRLCVCASLAASVSPCVRAEAQADVMKMAIVPVAPSVYVISGFAAWPSPIPRSAP